LAIVQVGDVELLECVSCNGLWIAAADFERICANHAAQAAVLERWRPSSTDAGKGPIHYRPCLLCGKMMNRMNFGRLSGTIIDLCRGHGAFLDAGELHAIVTFIQAGGLDRARQREKDDLEEERRRLSSLQMQIESRSRAADWEHQSKIGDSLLELRRLLKGE
jgi:Zn-finger nucleic acid-binding protein